ncbi:MAG: mechanosensitive ion channel [Bdellovibrionales bacterium]|nr:mechanosensitive ion channel [Bdellovibrionales bacterium]
MFHFFIGNLSWDKEKFFEKIREIFDILWMQIPTFWNYTLFFIDENPITAGDLIFGVGFLIFGYMGIRYFIYEIDKRILSRLNIDIPHRYTIKIFLFYILIVILFLITLYFINVPLTVFTFIGGALALGIGFGAKNIMNNLLCGIVIVSEHPIRVGDLIEVDNLLGVVENVGFRATSIRSLDNTHILIPNSVILENSILNWTLSDKVIRSTLKLSVTYGSDPEKVKEVLLRIAHDHERILTYNKDQMPTVFFSDFGESGLFFELSYWIVVNRPLDMKLVASELRMEIKKAFKKEKIIFPFNQMDIHVKETVKIEKSEKFQNTF